MTPEQREREKRRRAEARANSAERALDEARSQVATLTAARKEDTRHLEMLRDGWNDLCDKLTETQANLTRVLEAADRTVEKCEPIVGAFAEEPGVIDRRAIATEMRHVQTIGSAISALREAIKTARSVGAA